ncbi:MAG: hypothetical protein AAF842_01820 [Planctomycetota bacterium]
MSSSVPLVLQLQNLASSSTVTTRELLRKAMLVASKLGLEDFKSWLSSEMQGYPAESEVPKYRQVHAELKAKNPYHGLIPLVIEDSEMARHFSDVKIREPVGNLAEMLARSGDSGGSLTLGLSSAEMAWLMQGQGDYGQLPPVRTVSRGQIVGIVDAVQNHILDWALRLESDGVLGEGMSFSHEEKEIAASTSNLRIENFQGVLGNVANSQLTQNLVQEVSKGDFASLDRFFRSKGLSEEDVKELRSALAQDGDVAVAGKPGAEVSQWISKMLAKAADGSWQIGLGAAGGLLSQAIAAYYGI